MASAYLSGLNAHERSDLERRLLEIQHDKCFICEKEIDLNLHSGEIDIDHVEPLAKGGLDREGNLAITHSSCNRSKQASDLRVARVLARLGRIREASDVVGHGTNLADILSEYGGAKFDLHFTPGAGEVKLSLAEIGRNDIVSIPLYKDQLSGLDYFFMELPIEYLHHDDKINPRNIGTSIAGLIEEFHKGLPQLHAALAWVDKAAGPAAVKVFDGQHKAAAQVLLGVRSLPIRVFVNPDPGTLVTANTHAGTTLRQVAFDKSVQRRLGRSLFADRLDRYRSEKGLPPDDESMSEKDLMTYFKGETKEMKRYAVDTVRDGITQSPDNALVPYIEFGGKSTAKPLSYSTVEKTFFSFFIYTDALQTPLNYLAEEGLNPRTLEVEQVVKLMNLVAEVILINKYNFELGAARIEKKVRDGDDVPEPHLRAFRMCREEIMTAWLKNIGQVVQYQFTFDGKLVDAEKLFQHKFPEPLWDKIRNYLENLAALPLWVNHELAGTVFGGRQSADFWKTVFQSAKTPDGRQVLAAPLDLMQMIQATG